MPTAEEFDWAAGQLTHSASTVERLGMLVADLHDLLGPSVLAGGALAALVSATIDVSHRNTALVSEVLGTDIATCRARAEVCRAYRADLAAYRADLDRWQRERDRLPPGEPPPPLAPRPQPPARWVES